MHENVPFNRDAKSVWTRPFPPFVYQHLDTRTLVRSAYDSYLASMKWKEGGEGDVSVDFKHFQRRWGPSDVTRMGGINLLGAELDPVKFSFYLASNLPLCTEDLQTILEADTLVERLLKINSFLHNGRYKFLACGVCGQQIARKKDIFTVPGAEGMVGSTLSSCIFLPLFSYCFPPQ